MKVALGLVLKKTCPQAKGFIFKISYYLTSKKQSASGGLGHYGNIINTCCLTTIIAIIAEIVVGPRPHKKYSSCTRSKLGLVTN